MYTFSLSNGSKVIFKKQKGSNAAAILFAFNVGSVNESPHLQGVSHFLEHMIFKGTERFPHPILTNEIQSMGGDPNAFTSFEMTAFLAEIPKNKFDGHLLELWLDALRFPLFQEQAFELEKRVVLEEIKMKMDAPGRRTWDLLRELVFTRHRYGIEIKGYPRTILPLKPSDMRSYWASYYRPDNLTIIVVGDFENVFVEDLLSEACSSWISLGSLQRDDPPPEPIQDQPRIGIHYSDVNHAYLRIGFPGPSFTSDHRLPLDIALDSLARGRSSRLYRALVEPGICNSVQFSADISGRDTGMIDLSIVCDPLKLDEAVNMTVLEVQRFMTEGPTGSELAKLKNQYEKDFLSTNEDAMGVGITIASYDNGGASDRFETYLEDVEALTRDEILEALNTYLNPSRASMILYAPEQSRQIPYENIYTPDSLYRLLSGPERSRSARQSQPTFHRDLTRSGAVVLLDRFPRWPLFCTAVVCRGGLCEETQETAGITSLLLNVLLRTKTQEGSALTTQLEELGGTIFPFVDLDYCGFIVTGLAKNFSVTMDILTEFLEPRQVPSEHIALERENALSRIKREQDNIMLLAIRFFRQQFYRNHPYGIPTHGTAGSVTTLGRDSLETWRKKLLTAGRTFFAFSGRYDADAAILAAEKIARELSKEPMHELTLPEFIPFAELAREEMFRDKQQANFVLGFPAPRGSSLDRYGMHIISTDLSSSGNRLYQVMRDEKGLCYHYHAMYVAGRQCGHMEIYVGTSPEREEEAIENLLTILRAWREDPINMEEFTKAQEVAKGRYVRSHESAVVRISSLIQAEILGLSEDHVYDYSAKITNVSPELYDHLRHEVIHPENGFLAVIKPKE